MTAHDRGQGGPTAGQLNVRITSLEMLARPARPSAPIPAALRIERAIRPSVAFYRFLYDTVGESWLWALRRRWSDDKLAATVHDPAVEVWILSVDGQPAGYAELDRRVPEQVELAYFGLMPTFVGRGFGPHLLRFAIDRAWDADPRRLWVHTSSFDHPAALGLYKRSGFEVFKVEDGVEEDPRIEGLIRADAAPHVPYAGQE